MIISLQTQVGLIFYSMIAGLIIGIMFDIYRIIRGFKDVNKIVTFIQDILFWILNGIIIFIFLLYTNQGYIGPYVYLFITIGILLYIKFISRFSLIFLYSIIDFIVKMFRRIKNLIVYPFQLLIHNNKKNIKNK